LANDTEASVFFWEAQPTDASLARMGQIGLTSAVVTPLANAPQSGDFVSVMGNNLDQIRDAFANPSSG
jgi:hypothetical protein